ncbi:MAG TPA: lamin tail domain-containing protein [Gaiellaceae bacterium]|nr:lamin tail domain-containing protein [Gaiellaceae bacterium]
MYDTSGTVTFTCVAQTSLPTQASLRINEIETGTTASAADEFVEIVNSGENAVEIGGWKVVYRSASGTSDTTLATIPTGTTLAPGGFYLLGGAAYEGAVAADQTFSAGLAATGGAAGIRDASGALVDSAGWGTATNALVEGSAAAAAPTTAAPGSSIVRLPDGHDTNANAADFTISATPTPKAANH